MTNEKDYRVIYLVDIKKEKKRKELRDSSHRSFTMLFFF